MGYTEGEVDLTIEIILLHFTNGQNGGKIEILKRSNTSRNVYSPIRFQKQWSCHQVGKRMSIDGQHHNRRVGFQTVDSFMPIDGVGHLGFSLVKKPSAFCLLILLRTTTLSRLTCLFVFSFQEVFFSFSLRFPNSANSQRESGILSSLFPEVYHCFILCLWDVFPTIHLSSKTNSRVSLKSYPPDSYILFLDHVHDALFDLTRHCLVCWVLTFKATI